MALEKEFKPHVTFWDEKRVSEVTLPNASDFGIKFRISYIDT